MWGKGWAEIWRLNYGNERGSPVTLAPGGAQSLGGGARGTFRPEREGLRSPSGDVTLRSPGQTLELRILRSGFPVPLRPYGGPGPARPRAHALPATRLRLAALG